MSAGDGSEGSARTRLRVILDWMEFALNPDLFVMPSQNIVVRTIRFPPEMGPQIAAIEGVDRVQMVRDARIVFRRNPAGELTGFDVTAGMGLIRSVVRYENPTFGVAIDVERFVFTPPKGAKMREIR